MNQQPRRIIQIAVAGGSVGPCSAELELSTELWALCNDGTVWFLQDAHSGWIKTNAIPQDAAEELPLFAAKEPQTIGEMFEMPARVPDNG